MAKRLNTRERRAARKERDALQAVDPRKNSSRNKTRRTFTDPVTIYKNTYLLWKDSYVRIKAKEELLHEKIIQNDEFKSAWSKHVELGLTLLERRENIGDEVFELPEYFVNMLDLEFFKEERARERAKLNKK